MNTKTNKNEDVSFLKYSPLRTVLGELPFRKGSKRFFLSFVLILFFSFLLKPDISKGAENLTTIPSQYLTLISTDSYNRNYPAKYAVDGNTSTFWHTEWITTISNLPHELVIDIGSSQPIAGLQYLPRQDSSTEYGYIKGYEIYISDDLNNWGNAAASGSFDIFRGDPSQKETTFPEKSGRYVKFVALSNAGGTPYSAAAEIRILATTFDPPFVIPALTGPEITVGLWSYTKDSLNETPFKVEANKKYNIKNSAGDLIASVEGNIITRVSYVSDKNFKVYNSIPETLINKEVIFESADGNNSDMIFDIYRPLSTYDQYRGKVKIRYTDSNNIWVINTLPMEHYVWGMGETTGTGPMEHTKLMTMTFRTYGYWYITYATKYLPYGFRIKSDSGNQIYRGYDWETTYPNIKLAAASTKGKIVTYKNEIALTPYSSWTDGRTRSFEERWGSTDYPWCKSVSDPYGKHPTMTTAQLEAAGNHMVGVSANGSVKLAGNSYNWDYAKILKYYYTGIEITSKY